MPKLLERARELERIGAGIERAREGAGELLLIEGPAGIGKSALLEAAAELAAERGVGVLAARATELEREFPFGPARQLLEPPLRAAAPELRAELLAGSAAHAAPALGIEAPEPTAAAASGFATLNGLYWLIAGLAEHQPLVLLLDDAHWADPDSLRFLAFLTPRLAELPALLLCAARPEEWDAPAPLAATASDPAARALAPAPLSEDATATVLDTAFEGPVDPSFAAACHIASAGNPFYLHTIADELRRDRVEPSAQAAERVLALGPPAVARAIVARLGRLGDDAAALARAVAVLGEGTSPEHAGALAGLEPGAALAAAEPLARAEILAGDERLRFAHPITRNAVYGDIPRPERAELHRRAVALLTEAGAAPERLAAHLLALPAASDPEVVETLRASAGAAAQRGAADAAIAYLRRALAEPPGDEGQLRAVHRELGLAEVQMRLVGGVEQLRAALELAGSEPALHAEIATELALALVHFARQPEAVDLLRQELGRSERAPIELRLPLEVEFASTVLFGLDPPLAELDARLDKIADHASPDSAAGRRLLISLALRLVQRGQDAPRAAELAEGVIERGLLDDVGPDSTVGFNAWATLMGCGALEQAERWAADGLRRAQELARPLGMTMNLNLLSFVVYARGDILEAEATASDSLRLVREHEISIGHPAVAAAMVDALAARGEASSAWRELDRDGFTGDLPQVLTSAWLLEARGRLRAADGDHEGALEDLELGGEWFRRWGAVAPGFTSWRSDAVDSLIALGRRDEARELAEEDLRLARGFGAQRSCGRALRARALTREGEELIAGLGEAVSVLADCGAQLDHARALVDLGAAIRRSGRRAEAREPLGSGLELARSCGAVPLVERAYDELQATGARPRKILRTGADALTPSERRVADMAVSGLTNREIAQRLFVTTKTIEFHLGQAYRKLEIGSRSELEGALGEGGG